MTISGAANHFHVPRKTLDDRIKVHMEHGSKPGRNPVLSAVKEDALVVYLLYMADLGCPLTRTLVKAFAWALARQSGNGDSFNAETGPREHWWTNFKSRHPEISLQICDMLECTRAKALNQVTVKEYFTLLSKTLAHGWANYGPPRSSHILTLFGEREYSRLGVLRGPYTQNQRNCNTYL